MSDFEALRLIISRELTRVQKYQLMAIAEEDRVFLAYMRDVEEAWQKFLDRLDRISPAGERVPAGSKSEPEGESGSKCA